MLSSHNKTIARYFATHAIKTLLRFNISANLLTVLNFVKIYYRKFLAVFVVFANRKLHVSIFYLLLSSFKSIFSKQCLIRNYVDLFSINKSISWSHESCRYKFVNAWRERNFDFLRTWEIFSSFFFFFSQSNFRLFSVNVNQRRRNEKKKMSQKERAIKSFRRFRDFINVYETITFSINANQQKVINYFHRKQNQFIDCYNDFFADIDENFKKFENRFDLIEKKLKIFNIDDKLDSKLNAMKNKMNITLQFVVQVVSDKVVDVVVDVVISIMKIEFDQFKKKFKTKLKVEFVNKIDVFQETITSKIVENISFKLFASHQNSENFHNYSNISIQNFYSKQNARNEIKQKTELIFSIVSNYSQNRNIYSVFQFVYEIHDNSIQSFNNDSYDDNLNHDVDEKRKRQSRFDYSRNHDRQRNHHFRSRSSSSNKLDEFRDVMLIRQNQFKFENIDFFYLKYIENKNFIDYVINEKKIIYISVQLFVQTVKQYVINNENVLKHLYFCLRDAIQIW